MKVEQILENTLKDANEYLSMFGLKIKVLDDRLPGDNAVAEYEYESVFSDSIKIRINLYEIMKLSNPEELPADIRVTVFHEIGHAFMNFIEEMSDEEIAPYKEAYFDVFYDDNGVDEEDIVEEFCQSFDDTNVVTDGYSLLRELVELMLENGVEF